MQKGLYVNDIIIEKIEVKIKVITHQEIMYSIDSLIFKNGVK